MKQFLRLRNRLQEQSASPLKGECSTNRIQAPTEINSALGVRFEEALELRRVDLRQAVLLLSLATGAEAQSSPGLVKKFALKKIGLEA